MLDADQPSPRYLYYTVQLQHIIEQADSGAFSASSSLHEPGEQSLNGAYAAFGATLTQLRSTVDSIKTSLPFSIHESPFLKMQFYTAELYLCLIGVSTNATFNTLPTDEQWPPWRLDFLSAGIVAAKSLLDFYLMQPPGAEQNHNNTEWIQISFALTLAARLSMLTSQQSIQQQTAHLRSFLGMSGILQEFVHRMYGLVTDKVDDKGDRDVFFHTERRLRRLQTWFEAQSSCLQNHPVPRGQGLGRAGLAQFSVALNTMDQSMSNDLSTLPDMSSLLQLECSSVWMDDFWLDGMINFPEAGSNVDSGEVIRGGLNDTTNGMI